MCEDEENRVKDLEKQVEDLEASLNTKSTVGLLEMIQEQSKGRNEVKVSKCSNVPPFTNIFNVTM